MKKSWMQAVYDKEVAELLYKSLGVSFQLCVILAQRGISSQCDAEKFLWPKLTHLDDPFKIKNIDRAVDMLLRIIANKMRVAVVGDYDVDGITAVTLVTNVLKDFGVSSDFFVPRRAFEGYGLSAEIIKRVLSEKKYDAVIALDCGTNSADEIEFLLENDIEVLIVDHHQAKRALPDRCCMVNPHVSDHEGDDRYKILCTAGLVFKLCYALVRVLRRQNNKRALDYSLKNDLDLVALGTIADMANLVRENRIFCKFGLKILSGKSRRPGIEALCKSSDIQNGTNVGQSDVSFKLCPRLNACGRLSDASLPIKMMLSDNFDEAMTYAYELDETNRERQSIEKNITKQAAKLVKTFYGNDSGLVLYNRSWHSGVVGIVSGKFAKDYSRPCIVLGNERGLAKGSGRSTNINLIDVLGECAEYLETWGGHPYAVGVSICPTNVDRFRKSFNEAVKKHSTVEQRQSGVIAYSLELQLDEINNALVKELELLQPFGQRNNEPIFLLANMKINGLPETFGAQKSHLKFWLNDKYSKRMLVIGWNGARDIPPICTPLDLLVTVNRETWNGINSTCLNMIDWRISKKR
jgi:single-stranded-DNA-specific exonuclease